MHFALTALLSGLTILFAIHVARWTVQQLPDRIFPHGLFIVAHAGYYSVGFLTTSFLLNDRQYFDLLELWRVPSSGLTHAAGIILGFCVLVHLAAVLLPRIFSFPSPLLTNPLQTFTHRTPYLKYSVVVLAVQLALMFTGKIGYMGTQSDPGTNQISPLAQLVFPFGFSLFLIAGYRISQAGHKLTTLVPVLAEFALTIPAGRRVFVLGVILFLFGAILGGFTFRRLAKTSLLLVPLVIFAFYGFYAIRVAHNELGPDAQLREQLSRASQVGTRDSREVSSELSSNLKSRSFIIGYLGLLASRPYRYQGTGGEALFLEAMVAVPRVLFPNKDAYINISGATDVGGAEYLTMKHFALPRFEDEPTTLLTTFYADFRELGVFLAIPFLAAWLCLFKLATILSGSALIRIVLSVMSLYICLYIEDGPVVWFVGLRNAALLTTLTLLFALGANSAQYFLHRRSP